MTVECQLEEDIKKNYSCVICHKKIHRGDEACPCSTFRKETFDYASICADCATAFDRLMNDKELQPILKHLLNKEYWKNRVVIDF